MKTSLNEVFVDEDFLFFLQTKFPELDFVQDSKVCNIVHHFGSNRASISIPYPFILYWHGLRFELPVYIWILSPGENLQL